MALQARCAARTPPIEVTRVGDPPALPLGTTDPELLLWAERETRVIVTPHKGAVRGHLVDHLAAGRHSAGVFRRRPGRPWSVLLDALVFNAETMDPPDMQDVIRFGP